jgi:tetratricopeptide (TPR) repeat protein
MSIVASDAIAQTTARDYCNRGVAREKKGDLDGALADYTRAIELNPHDATPYNNRGLVKVAKGDLDGALADYDRALQIRPRNFETHDNRGVVRQKKGDLDGALTDYNIAIKLWWKCVPAYSHRASIEIAKNDLDRALANYNWVIYLDPKDAAAYNNRALVETAKGDLDAATADFKRAATLDPKYARNSPPPANKGKAESAGTPDENRPTEPNAKNVDTGRNHDLTAQKKDDLSGARPKPDYTPPIEIEPKNIAAVYDRDVAKRKNDEHNGAIVDHTPANERKNVGVRGDGKVGQKTGLSDASVKSSPTVELPSTNVETSSRLELGKPTTGDLGGRVAEARGAGASNNLTLSDDVNVSKQNLDLSSTSVDQHRPAKPTVPNIPNEADLAKQGKADLNIVPADHSRAAEPNNLRPPENASVSTQKDNLNRDSSDYHRPTEPDPTTAFGYDNRAQFRKAKGDLNGALADYDRAIQLDPKYAAAYNGRGNIKRAKSDLDGALADYSRAIELNGGNAIAYYNRGVTRQTKGDLDGALADFNPAIQLDPKNAGAYHSRGAARAMEGDLSGALTDYNRAIELNSKDAATYNNRADLFFSVRNWGAALEDYNRFFELSKEGQEYPRLYVWLIHARTGQTDAANKELVDYLQQRGNTVDWFSTVASYLLGGISDADLLAAARSSDKRKEDGQLCETWFYIGMKKLIGGNRSGAQDCFNKSLATDQKDYTEYHFARAELKALPN